MATPSEHGLPFHLKVVVVFGRTYSCISFSCSCSISSPFFSWTNAGSHHPHVHHSLCRSSEAQPLARQHTPCHTASQTILATEGADRKLQGSTQRAPSLLPQRQDHEWDLFSEITAVRQGQRSAAVASIRAGIDFLALSPPNVRVVVPKTATFPCVQK